MVVYLVGWAALVKRASLREISEIFIIKRQLKSLVIPSNINEQLRENFLELARVFS